MLMDHELSRYEVGQVVPWAAPDSLLGGGCAPVWHVLRTRPNREVAARSWLRANGVTAWYPEERVFRRCRRGRVASLRRMLPGYLFARFDRAPSWHVLLDRQPGALYVSGVLSYAETGQPAPLRMRDVEALMAMPSAADAMMRAQASKPVRVGDLVTVMAGIFEGQQVRVSRVEAGLAGLVIPLIGQTEVTCPVAMLSAIGKQTA